MAQQVPSAGGQLQQIPRAPAPAPSIPDVRVERPGTAAAPAAAGPAFRVDTLQVTGATAFPAAELVTATGFRPGEFTLGDLRTLAIKVADFYHARGYFVAQAYLPAQEVAAGAVTIVVVEGRYGAVTIDNTSRLSTGVAARTLSGLDHNDLVENAPLERRLLLLADTPGIAVRSTLAPGTAVGTSDLRVEVRPGDRITGSAEADNAGNRYTGYFRLGGVVALNDPFGIGDQLSARGLVSDGGLTYGRVAYQAPVFGATVGVAYARLDYRLHREFQSLGAHGSADIGSVYASYPLIRSYNANLNALAGVDFKFFHDEIDSVHAVSDKQSQVGAIGLSGDSRDHFGGGGVNFFSGSVSAGSLDIRTPGLRALDATTARTNGGFAHVNLAAGRTQALGGPLSLYVAARGQLASKNLDISEKMELGGAYGVRAYPEGEAYGDEGYIATAELRLRIDALSRHVPGDVELFGFVDNGGVTFSHNRYFAGSNHTNLSGAGVGATWAEAGNFLVRVSYAHRIGNTPVKSEPDHAGRVWFQVVKLF